MTNVSTTFSPLRAFQVLAAVLMFALAGCSVMLAPVLDVHEAPVAPSPGATADAAMVRAAILRAFADRGWEVREESSNAFVAEVSAGGHSATVKVVYSERAYSITYVDSSPGLKHDGANIHRRYNHWVDRLRASINRELRNVVPAAPAGYLAPPPAPATTGEVPPPPPPAAVPPPPSPALTPAAQP